MIGTTYDLTLRRENLLELYENQFHFDWKSAESRKRILYSLFFLAGLILTVLNLFSYDDRSWPFIVCSIGAGYNFIMLYNEFHKTREIKKNVNEWIDAVSVYKKHWILMGENSFTYYRDHEMHRYDLGKIHEKYSDDIFFKLTTVDGDRIIIPSKSFDEGMYTEFIKDVNVIALKLKGEQATT